MLRVPLSRCREGLILGDSVYDDAGRLLLSAGTVCGQRQFEAMAKRGVDEFPVILPHETDRIRGNTLPLEKEIALYEAARCFLPMMAALPSRAESRIEIRRLLYEAITPIAQVIVDRYRSEAAGATGGRSLFIAPRMIGCLEFSFFEHAKNMALAAMVVAVDYFAAGRQVLSEVIKAGAAGLLHDCGWIEEGQTGAGIEAEASALNNVQWLEHPARGRDRTAGLFRDQDSEVIRAVFEHEECGQRQGFPQRIGLEDMHPLSQILSALELFYSMTGGAGRGIGLSPIRCMMRLNAGAGRIYGERVVKIMNYRHCPFSPGSIIHVNRNRRLLVEGIGNTILRLDRVRIYADEPDRLNFNEIIPNTPESAREFRISAGANPVEWGNLLELAPADCMEWDTATVEDLLVHYNIINAH